MQLLDPRLRTQQLFLIAGKKPAGGGKPAGGAQPRVACRLVLNPNIKLHFRLADQSHPPRQYTTLQHPQNKIFSLLLDYTAKNNVPLFKLELITCFDVASV